MHQAGSEPIPLDTSAVIYPPTVARFNTHVFRISMDLYVPVEKDLLLAALNALMPRFPYFSHRIHSGFFWYYLMNNNSPLEVYEEVSAPCGHLDLRKGANGYMFKVFYTEHRIAVEYFHALTDGTGGITFLKSLVAEYLRQRGNIVDADPQVLLPGEPVDPQETEDSFAKIYRPMKSVFDLESRAFHYNPKGAHYSDDHSLVSAVMDVEQVKEQAKKWSLTITEYLVCEVLSTLQELQKLTVQSEKRWKPVRLSVPVNIRRIYGSKSLRNFTLFVVVGLDTNLGTYSFEEIVKSVYHQMRGKVNEKALSLQISRNVAGRRIPLIRYAPNILKRPLMKLLSDSYGDTIYSSVISNLGNVTLPDGMEEDVRRVDFSLSPSQKNKFALAVISAKGQLVLNITSILAHNREFERLLLVHLVRKGLKVTVDSNG